MKGVFEKFDFSLLRNNSPIGYKYAVQLDPDEEEIDECLSSYGNEVKRCLRVKNEVYDTEKSK